MTNDKIKLNFPCTYTIKVIGKDDQAFKHAVDKVIQSSNIQLTALGIKTNTSSQKKYKSLSINFTATSKQQLDDIYKALTDLPEVLWAL